MPRVRFSMTRTVQDGTGLTFQAGEEYDLSPASANRWVRRGLAVVVPDQEPPPVPPPDAPGSAPLRLDHAGGGLWHVVAADGAKVTAAPLSAAEARAVIAQASTAA